MKTLITILACCVAVAVAFKPHCPNTKEITPEHRNYVRNQLVSRVTVVEKIPRALGYTEYKITYDHDYEKWAQVYNHYRRPSIPMHESCGSKLEVGKSYLVGYNGQFYFVRDLDTITEKERGLLGFDPKKDM
ncbi:hypothetical protein ANCCAN_05271 [Ancylostoma caninum]|uniref:Uncharacterized protein n=1 Tax=Ancylostoma caninum TaxID=29170 RepID=A0A368GW90_ANCCA|nr:hypothetical protein ANCCAN_05271 [Ancylostoma caninum]